MCLYFSVCQDVCQVFLWVNDAEPEATGSVDSDQFEKTLQEVSALGIEMAIVFRLTSSAEAACCLIRQKDMK